MHKNQLKPVLVALAIAGLCVELAAGSVPVDVRLIPAGEFRACDGRPAECAAWVMLDEDGERLVAEAAARSSAYVIDYEHATLHAKKTGSKAVAGGWYKQLEWRSGDGLWAIGVDWTALAAQHIADREYRYISPLFSYDPKTGRVGRLLCASLTNDPGLDGLTDLAALAANFFLDQPTMEATAVNEELLEQLRWMLNLPVGTTAEEISAHLSKLIMQLKGDGATAAASFDLPAHLAALSAQVAAPDPSRFVPVATLSALQGEHADLQGQLAALHAEVNSGKLEKIIVAGLSAGKLTPAIEGWARALGEKDIAALSSFIDAAPVVVTPGATQSGGLSVSDGNTAALSAEAKSVCALLGVSEEDFKQSLSASA